MKILSSCQEAIHQCIQNRTFTLAHLYTNEIPKSREIHLHDNYEINYSVSGGKQFLIDRRVYPIQSGDLFFINPYESHYPAPSGSQPHERIVISIYPDYLKRLSSPDTDLTACFTLRPAATGHKLTLTESEQAHFLSCIRRLSAVQGYGADLLEMSVFLELMVALNHSFLKNADLDASSPREPSLPHSQAEQILAYIDSNLQDSLSIEDLSNHFFLSSSYLSRIFKNATGTTINKYITARRISRAKALLTTGLSVGETAELCGFHDYSNFLKTFSKAVGITPKKYAAQSLSSRTENIG